MKTYPVVTQHRKKECELKANETMIFLTELGLEGRSLTEMNNIIETQDELANFQRFIILHEHAYKTNPELVHQYILHLQNTTPITEKEFVDGFQDFRSPKNRTNVLKSLFCSSINIEAVNKVSNNINKDLPLELWYSKLMQFRSTMDAEKAVDLVLFQKELNIL